MKKPHSPISRKRPTTVFCRYRGCAWCLRYGPRAPYLVASIRRAPARMVDVVALLMKEEAMATRPPVPSSGSSAKLPPLADPGELGKLFPQLCSLLVDQQWDDGSPRQPAKLFVNVESGMWSGTIKEPNLGYLLGAKVKDPLELLACLEALLNLPNVPWVHDPWAKRQQSQKRK